MFNCPKCDKTLTFVNNYFIRGLKCEECQISKLIDNKNDPDISDEKIYAQLTKKYKSRSTFNQGSIGDEIKSKTPVNIENNKIIDVDNITAEVDNITAEVDNITAEVDNITAEVDNITGEGSIKSKVITFADMFEDTITAEVDNITSEDSITSEELKIQLQNKKNDFSVENKFIQNSLPSTTNPHQSEYFLKILKFIENSIKDGKKFIIVNAPTGIGKSHIAATLCKFLKEGVILTDQIALQLQYMQSFPWMNQVKGMGNFLCPDLEWDKTSNFGNCENCKFRCDKNDFEIRNKGTEQESVSVIQNSAFGDLPEEILRHEKNLDIILEKDKTIIAAQLLSKNEIEQQEQSLSRFVIKYKNHFFFVLPDEKIPKESKVQRDQNGLISRKNEICPYYQQRMMGEVGSFAVYNYAMYISTMLGKSTDSEKTRPRQILICDEAHNLENHLQNQGKIELGLTSIKEIINDKKIIDEIIFNTVQKKFLPLISNLEELLLMLDKKHVQIRKHRSCIKFLNSKIHVDKHRSEYCEKHKRTIKKCPDCSKLRKEMDNGRFLGCMVHFSEDVEIECKENHLEFTGKYVKKIREERKNLSSSIVIIKKIYKKFEYDENNFILQFEKNKNKIILQSVKVSETAQTLFSNFNHVVFLSSTIHEELFVNDMGMDDYVFKSFPNPIEPHNRIIKMWPSPLHKFQKNPKILDEQYEVIAQKITDILNNKHKNEKGLILVNSYADLRKLLPYLGAVKSRLTYNESKDDQNSTEYTNDELLKIHNSKENSVLFSPSMWEGVDLKGDLGRFCIIATAPYMPTKPEKNPYGAAKNRLSTNQDWMNMRNAFKFVQGTGRCVRGIDDRATTYVLDEGCRKHKNWLETYVKKDVNSKWFIDSMENY